jgi:hypothetical protein
MEFNQALEVINRAIDPKIDRPLTEVEVALLYGAWHNLNYDRIADRSGYSINYLQRDLGPKFWKLYRSISTILKSERPYEGTKIAGIKGIVETQKATLRALGAVD